MDALTPRSNHLMTTAMSDTILIPGERGIVGSGMVKEAHIDPAPVSRLPPEILEDIFSLCVSWFYTYQKPQNLFAWMQVCRAWRNIGLNSGCLWQRIDLTDCTVEFLVRSRQAPLYITATSPIKAVPLDLASHANRLHSLDVTLSRSDMIQLFLSLGRDLPTLANLSLKISLITSTIFLDLSLPSLRRLSLEGVSIRWEECRNLTYFSLRGHHQPLSLSRLLTIFASSPDLEYVRLEGFVPSSSDTVESPPITLCHLKDFIISSSPPVIRFILSSVNFGIQTRLQLYVSQVEDLCSIFPSRPLLQFADTQLPPNDLNNVRISRYGVCFIRNNSPAWCDDPSMFQLLLSSASPISVHICRSLGYVTELTSITRLELSVGVLLDIPLRILKGLFRDIRRLQSLCTAFNEIEDLLHILESIDETTRVVYLPHLVRLSFGKPADVWWYIDALWIKSILDALRTRREHACRLQILELCSCEGITPAMIEALEKVADEVVVMEQPDSDSFF